MRRKTVLFETLFSEIKMKQFKNATVDNDVDDWIGGEGGVNFWTAETITLQDKVSRVQLPAVLRVKVHNAKHNITPIAVCWLCDQMYADWANDDNAYDA